METEQDPRPADRPIPLVWPVAALLLALALSAWDTLFLHPGVGAPEELGSVFYQLGNAADHWRHWFRFSGGAWTRLLQWALLDGFGDWRSLYLLNGVSLVLGSWALWTLAQELGGPLAGACALALLFSSPFTFLQARTLFCYVQVPAAAAGLVLALRRPWGWAPSLALGAAAALLWMDYEAWILIVPGAVAAWAWAPKGKRAHGPALLAGFLAGTAFVLLLGAPYWADWWGQRSTQIGGAAQDLLDPWVAALRRFHGYFMGGSQPPAMGLETWPAFPILGLPGLLLAAATGPGWVWVWAGGGLVGLLASDPLQEPNRAIVAWPALLLLAALGSARLLGRVRWGPRLLRGLLVLSPLLGFTAFSAAQGRWDARIHGLSRRLMAAGDFLEGLHAPLGPPVDPVDQAFLCRDRPDLCGQTGSNDSWILVPRTMADPADARWGVWRGFRSGSQSPPTWLLLPSPRARALFDPSGGVAAGLDAILDLPTEEALAALRQRAPEAGGAVAWTLWRTQRSRFALRVGQAQADDLLPLLEGPCLDPAPLEEAAGALRPSRPDLAQRFERRARQLQAPGERWRVAMAAQRP